ncbi:MAG TPA: Calx-beta domain-containing protein, partial [Pyrinomonadaceae bacterium]|nr:Calx-beta domain-containing protein [Pyrinomonadaceae bacterium]
TDDALDETNETINLKLSNPTGAMLGAPDKATLTITDNDPLPTLAVDSPTITEGNTPAVVNFTVSLSEPSGRVVTVRYQTADGTAKAPADYTAKGPATLTFLPGETTKTIAVRIAGDTRDEPTETFKLQLFSPTGATVAVSAGTCTITDNDPPPRISINNVSVTEPDTGTISAVFTVKLSAVSEQTVTVKYATGGGTAAAGTDYTALALTTLTFSPGQTTKTVTVQVKGDTVKEANETFFVNLSAPTNASFQDERGTGTITNDD